jgi:hypothetical protein
MNRILALVLIASLSIPATSHALLCIKVRAISPAEMDFEIDFWQSVRLYWEIKGDMNSALEASLITDHVAPPVWNHALGLVIARLRYTPAADGAFRLAEIIDPQAPDGTLDPSFRPASIRFEEDRNKGTVLKYSFKTAGGGEVGTEPGIQHDLELQCW